MAREKKIKTLIIKDITGENYLINYKLNRKNITIYDSYKITRKDLMKRVLKTLLTNQFDPYLATRDRNIDQYVREWRAHNILYKLPFKKLKKHCTNTDLSNNESKFRLFIYNILGRF